MRFDDERKELCVLDRRFPVHLHRHEDHEIPGMDPMKSRQAIILFENKWGLSLLWGNFAYGSNYVLRESGLFNEEPDMYEVGIFSPDGRVIEGTVYTDLDGEPKVIPDYVTALWTDPLGYVTDEQCLELISWVSKLPSTGLDRPPDCYYVDDMLEYFERNVRRDC